NVVFIGGFCFSWGGGWGPWGWGWGGYPFGFYGFGFYGYGPPYGFYGPYSLWNSHFGFWDGLGSGYGKSRQIKTSPPSTGAELQRRLTGAGYYSGRIDGALGPQTQQAIRAYMEDHGYTSSSASPAASDSP